MEICFKLSAFYLGMLNITLATRMNERLLMILSNLAGIPQISDSIILSLKETGDVDLILNFRVLELSRMIILSD